MRKAKINQIVFLQERGIYKTGARNPDPLANPKMKERGGKISLKTEGGWTTSKSTGKKVHNRVQVVEEKSDFVIECAIKSGKKKVKIELGNRNTYPTELKLQVEKDHKEFLKVKSDRIQDLISKDSKELAKANPKKVKPKKVKTFNPRRPRR